MNRIRRYSLAPSKIYLPASHQLTLSYTSTSIKDNVSDKLSYTSYFRQLILPYTSSAFKSKISDKLNYSSYFSTFRTKLKVSNKLGYSYYFPVSCQLIHTSSATKSEVPDNLGCSHDIKDGGRAYYFKFDSFLEACVYKDQRTIFRLLRETEKEDFDREIAKKDDEIARKDKDHKIEIAKKDDEIAQKDKEHKIEIAKKDNDHKIEIAKKDNELAIAAVKTVSCG
jgi:hypothetical protein